MVEGKNSHLSTVCASMCLVGVHQEALEYVR